MRGSAAYTTGYERLGDMVPTMYYILMRGSAAHIRQSVVLLWMRGFAAHPQQFTYIFIMDIMAQEISMPLVLGSKTNPKIGDS